MRMPPLACLPLLVHLVLAKKVWRERVTIVQELDRSRSMPFALRCELRNKHNGRLREAISEKIRDDWASTLLTKYTKIRFPLCGKYCNKAQSSIKPTIIERKISRNRTPSNCYY